MNCYLARGWIDLNAWSEMMTDKFKCLPLLKILLIIDDWELIWISPIISSSINKYSCLCSGSVFFCKSDINWYVVTKLFCIFSSRNCVSLSN